MYDPYPDEPKIFSIIKECLKKNENERPNAKKIIKILDEIIKEYM